MFLSLFLSLFVCLVWRGGWGVGFCFVLRSEMWESSHMKSLF